MKNQYIALILKIVFISLPFICLSLYCALFPLHYLDGEVALWLQQKDYVTHDNTDNIDTIILGDSKAKAAFQPTLLSDSSYNLALGGGTSIEMYYSLKNYLKLQKRPPKTAFIAFGTNHYSYPNVFWSRSIYFHYFSNEEKIEIFKTAKILNDEAVLQKDYLIDLFCYDYYLLNKYAASLQKIKGRFDYNMGSYKAVSESRGHTYFGRKEFNDEVASEGILSSFYASDMLDFYLVKLINLCAENNIQVILEQLPLNEATFKVSEESFLNDFTEYMKSIETKFPGIIVNAELYSYDNNCFADPFHLNEQGSEEFCKEMTEKYPQIFYVTS